MVYYMTKGGHIFLFVIITHLLHICSFNSSYNLDSFVIKMVKKPASCNAGLLMSGTITTLLPTSISGVSIFRSIFSIIFLLLILRSLCTPFLFVKNSCTFRLLPDSLKEHRKVPLLMLFYYINILKMLH